jgi:hypothetical protein
MSVTMRAKLALIEEPVQRQQHLVPVLAVLLPQVAELDQPVDFRFAQIECDAAHPISAALTVDAHPLGRRRSFRRWRRFYPLFE